MRVGSHLQAGSVGRGSGASGRSRFLIGHGGGGSRNFAAGNFRDQRTRAAGSEESRAARGIGGDFFRGACSRARARLSSGNFHGDAGKQTAGGIDHCKRGLSAGHDRRRKNNRARNRRALRGDVLSQGNRRSTCDQPAARHEESGEARAIGTATIPRCKHGRDSTATGLRVRNRKVLRGCGDRQSAIIKLGRYSHYAPFRILEGTGKNTARKPSSVQSQRKTGFLASFGMTTSWRFLQLFNLESKYSRRTFSRLLLSACPRECRSSSRGKGGRGRGPVRYRGRTFPGCRGRGRAERLSCRGGRKPKARQKYRRWS